MKIKAITILTLLFSIDTAFAFSFTETSVNDRSFEFKNNLDATVKISNVHCTKTDGYDSLTVEGYYSPTGKWNSIGHTYKGSKIRKANYETEEIVPAYMKFCAMVNKVS